MKKLLFATALVASAAAFADGGPISAISFEGYTAGTNFVNGAAEVGEDGNDKSVGPFFYYDGEQDGSSVKAFGGENAAAPNIRRPLAFANASPNANYLDLSTEGGILWRGINNITQGGTQEAPTYDLGTEKAIAAGGLYLDTLVQFTPTEDGGTPDLTSGDKLAIWLNVDTNGVTNLQVRANLYDFGEAPSATATTFTLAPESGVKEIIAGQWYRLTVKAIPNVMTTDENGIISAFEIYVDGVQMCATTAQFTTAMAEMLSGMGALSADATAAIAANKFFPSLAEMGDQGDTPTLTAVGFKGSGALDDIVWTEEDPFAGGSSSDYVVEIDGSDVVITPQAGDLEALQAAIVAGGSTLDVTDVDAVNAALDAEIGSTGVKRWQALFLGLAPTEAGLATFKIDSISFNEDGEVEVTLPADVTLMTGRGVDITLKVMAAAEPNAAAADWDEASSATGSKTLPAIVPSVGATKEFYKVVVEFAASAAQD